MTSLTMGLGRGVPLTGGGVVATSLHLRAGARYEITLQGARRWVRIARILSVLPDQLVLQLDDGRQLTVPQRAILSARPLAVSDKAPRGSERGPAGTEADAAPEPAVTA